MITISYVAVTRCCVGVFKAKYFFIDRQRFAIELQRFVMISLSRIDSPYVVVTLCRARVFKTKDFLIDRQRFIIELQCFLGLSPYSGVKRKKP